MAKKGNLSNVQKGRIHQAAVKLGLIRGDDKSQYKLVLYNVCKVMSSTEMNQTDYDTLAAYFASCGSPISSIGNRNSKLENLSSRQIHKIEELRRSLPAVNIPGVTKQIFRVIIDVNDLSPREAGKLISALIDMKARMQ